MIPDWAITVALAVVAAACFTLAGRALRAGPGPDSRLERLLRDCRPTGLGPDGRPVDDDGCEPLSSDEEWRLGEISMDSIIDVPEPAYGTGEAL